MGTPDFSVPALKALLQSQHKISLVVTQPDRPKGRGRKTTPTPVKKVAQNSGIDIIQPENINSSSITEQLKSLSPDLFVVVAFGQKLSKEILDIPTIYPINIHASLLPKYRGSSPIQAAIANLDKTTGVTTMVMGEGLDTGDILLTCKTNITPDETAATLHDRLADMGAGLICSTLDAISDNSIKLVAQNHDISTYAPMLKKKDGEICWEESSKKICAKIRALTPWPGAFTYLDNKTLKIFKAEPILPSKTETNVKSSDCKVTPGTIIECHNNEIRVASGDGAVNILELMGKSGKRLKAEEFLRGNKLNKGMKLINNDS